MKKISRLRRACRRGFFTKWFPLASGDFTFRLMTQEEARQAQCAAEANSPLGQILLTEPSRPQGWNFPHLAASLVITFLLQMLFLPCLCWKGGVKLDLALMLDFLVLFRTLIAFVARERGNGWLIYVGLLYTSPFWIEAMVELVLAK